MGKPRYAFPFHDVSSQLSSSGLEAQEAAIQAEQQAKASFDADLLRAGIIWGETLLIGDPRVPACDAAFERYREAIARAREQRPLYVPDPWERLLTEIDAAILTAKLLQGDKDSDHDVTELQSFDARLAHLCGESGCKLPPPFPVEQSKRTAMMRRRTWLANYLETGDGDKGSTHSSLADLIGRVIRRLKAKPDQIRCYIWDSPESLDVSGINSAAAELGIGPIFTIGEAPPWWSWPNLPPDHPNNQLKIECLTIHHPDGTEFDIHRFGNELGDQSSLTTTETIARLEAWLERLAQEIIPLSAKVKDRRGRRQTFDAANDARLQRDWVAARASGSHRKEFCACRGIGVKDLKAAQTRIRARRGRTKGRKTGRTKGSVK